jgi:hypothetical protein
MQAFLIICRSHRSPGVVTDIARSKREADGETRTPDPFITSEVLYQLSYVGGAAQV